MIWRASINAFLNKFYSGIKFYVDYQAGLPTNDGLSPSTPVDTITTAISKASNLYRVPKVIYVMRGNPTKKGDIIDEQIVLDVPWTAIDFGFVPLQLTTDYVTGITLSADYCGVINANLDGLNQATGGIGINLGNGISNFVVASLIQNFKTYGILFPSGFIKIVENCVFSKNVCGVNVAESQGFCLNSIFSQNDTAVLTNGGDGAVFFTRNMFQDNIVDIEDDQYYYAAADGVGSVNKLTSASASWTPGEYIGFLLIDSSGKGYKITGNTDTELNIIGFNLDGTAKDVIPANGNFWIVHSNNDCVFYGNYWDKLRNASNHIYGDSNNDGILDSSFKIYPPLGIGIGKSSFPDIKPLTFYALSSDQLISYTDQSAFSIAFNDSVEFIEALNDIPSRNVKAGMIESILRNVLNHKVITELEYKTDSKQVKKTNVRIE